VPKIDTKLPEDPETENAPTDCMVVPRFNDQIPVLDEEIAENVLFPVNALVELNPDPPNDSPLYVKLPPVKFVPLPPLKLIFADPLLKVSPVVVVIVHGVGFDVSDHVPDPIDNVLELEPAVLNNEAVTLYDAALNVPDVRTRELDIAKASAS